MVNVTDKNIFVTQGDTVKLTLIIRDKDQKIYTMLPNDKIEMVVKKHCRKDEEFRVESNNNELIIDQNVTKQLVCGVYDYDIQLTFASGEINTIVPRHKFVVQKEVS